MRYFATSFTGGQITLIILVAVLFAALLAANAFLLYVFYYKRKKQSLCSEALQLRREALLEELNSLKYASQVYGADEDDEEDEYEETDDDLLSDVEDDEDGEKQTPNAESFRAEVLAVRDMSPQMRKRFGFMGPAYARKRYYVQSRYGFEAKLRASADEVKERYAQIADAFGQIEKVGVKRSFRRERVFTGRKTLGLILFRGKTLCVALALEPKRFENTKYRGQDMSDKKSFAAAPLLLRLTSERRTEYAKQLITALADMDGLALNPNYKSTYDLCALSRDELFVTGSLKITLLGEAPELDAEDEDYDDEADAVAATASIRAGILAVADMSDTMRYGFGLSGPEYDFKKYYVRYNYGFEAKLRMSSDEMKERYAEWVDEVNWYKKLAVTDGFRQKRICYKRKTLGLMLFRGKTLCVALALDPKRFENTKYRGIDVGDKKRFAQTPLLIKLTSARRLGYAKYLLNRLAEEKSIEANAAPVRGTYDLSEMTRNELFDAGFLKMSVIGEVPLGAAETR